MCLDTEEETLRKLCQVNEVDEKKLEEIFSNAKPQILANIKERNRDLLEGKDYPLSLIFSKNFEKIQIFNN
jgi:hypothetical protein